MPDKAKYVLVTYLHGRALLPRPAALDAVAPRGLAASRGAPVGSPSTSLAHSPTAAPAAAAAAAASGAGGSASDVRSDKHRFVSECMKVETALACPLSSRFSKPCIHVENVAGHRSPNSVRL